MDEPRPTPFACMVRGCCPRCGKGRLFKSWLEITDSCDHCGLSFKAHEIGDGPAFFGVLLVGALTAIGAVVVDIKFAPPLWVHAAIWIPFVVIGSLLSLRLMKALITAVQYQYRKDDFTKGN